MITYERKYPEKITVKLDGKVVGKIISTVSGKWQYRPKGTTQGMWSKSFAKLEDLKRSLESE